MVTAYAFDGAEHVDEITGGQVSYLDLTKENMLWMRFDWVLSYCFLFLCSNLHQFNAIRNLKNLNDIFFSKINFVLQIIFHDAFFENYFKFNRIEVAEHLSPEHQETYLKNVARHARKGTLQSRFIYI